jgi:SAM-dependent methyltransferase
VKAAVTAAFFRSGLRRREGAHEIMDDGAASPEELADNFDDIERANRWFCAAVPVLRLVRATQARTVLDVGCGSADLARCLVRDARRRRVDLAVTCLDRDATIVEIARMRTAGCVGVQFVRGDGVALPFPDASFDVVTCNLTLHHCEPAEAIRLLAELRRAARIAPLVCDLRRSRSAYAGAWLFSRLTSRNRLTRNDAPLSVARSYTTAEALELAELAGWRRPRARRAPFFRMVITDG